MEHIELEKNTDEISSSRSQNGEPKKGAKGKMSYKSTFKSNDTEEWLDVVFTRPIGYQWALFFNKFDIHPNTVTVLSMILGAACGFFFVYRADTPHGLLMNVIGVLLLMWANFYDSADGQLARMSGKKSELGRILDGASGDIWFISIYISLVIRLFPQNIPGTDVQWGWWALLLCSVCGFYAHTVQCRRADYYRNIHLFFLKGDAGSELTNSAQQKKIDAETSWSKDFIKKFFLLFYVNYCEKQEKDTPKFQAFFHRVKSQYGNDIPQWLRNEFRKGSLPLMKYTNILTFNTRAIALYISCLIDMPWLYLLFELTVLMALYIYLGHQHEKHCEQLLIKLQTNASN